ncbi:hypothetical protein BH11PLA2_BH11PLA2_14610 [soil metagenome]
MDADFLTYVVSEGRVVAPVFEAPRQAKIMLKELFDRYREIASNGFLEANTVCTMNIHFEHILKVLGAKTVVEQITLDDIQKYIDRRSKMKRGKRPISPDTIRAEITSLRACWNWAIKAKKMAEPFPSTGLMFPNPLS